MRKMGFSPGDVFSSGNYDIIVFIAAEDYAKIRDGLLNIESKIDSIIQERKFSDGLK